MELIAKQIHSSLIKRKQTIAVAESCTGGLLSNLLTYIKGSSKYFSLGVVAYSNESKQGILKIPTKLIVKNGAVSEKVALKMAQQVKKIAKADFGIGVTGIAGPTGGTLQKPVGTVFIAVASKNKTIYKIFRFTGNRAAVRRKSSIKALELLKNVI